MAPKSTGQRIFGGVAIVLSVIVLLLAVGGIIGTWTAYSPVTQVTTGVLEGVAQLKARIPTLVTIVALVITLLLGWSAYAMVVLIWQGWSDLRG